ncbi:hypothetical protein [Amycolatopsis sp. cmx-4-68]|uniref:hypothetical protein n=1 Tax=Amycolatopsis sp. cmx-4-68 TaxID=2790938 RepID=UPI00397A8B41
MSSGKTSRYRLGLSRQAGASAAQRRQQRLARERLAREHEQRALAQAQARQCEATATYMTLQQKVREASTLYGDLIDVTMPVTPSVTGGTLTEVRAATRQLEGAVRAAAEKLRAQVADVRAASIVPPASHSWVSTDESHHTAKHQQVAEELRSLDAEADPAARADIEKLVRAILDDPNEARARASIEALHYDIGRANRAALVARARSEEIVALRSRLVGLGTTESEHMIARLNRLLSGTSSIPDTLRQSVDAVVAQAVAEQDRLYALKALANCCEEIGLEVDFGFETAADFEKPSFASSANWSHHAVEIKFNAADETVDFEVVRTTINLDPSEDHKIQKDFCGKYDELIAVALHHGVELVTLRNVPPGASVRSVKKPEVDHYQAPKTQQRRL